MERTTVTMPKELSEKAHAIGLNISTITRNAVAEMIRKIEQAPEAKP